MKILLKKTPILITIMAAALTMSACGGNEKPAISRANSTATSTTKDNKASDINIDVDDIKVRVSDDGVYTEVGKDIKVETTKDRVKVKVGDINIDVETNNSMVGSIISEATSWFKDEE